MILDMWNPTWLQTGEQRKVEQTIEINMKVWGEIKEAKQVWIEEWCRDIEEYHSSNKPKMAFQLMKDLTKTKTSQSHVDVEDIQTSIFTGTATTSYQPNTILLTQRARVACTSQSALKQENNIRQALLRCNYPSWALNTPQAKTNHKLSSNQAHITDSRHRTNNNNKSDNIFLVVPYIRGLSEVCNKTGILAHPKGNNTFHNLLVTPPRTRPWQNTLGNQEGLKEHLRAPPPFTNIV